MKPAINTLSSTLNQEDCKAKGETGAAAAAAADPTDSHRQALLSCVEISVGIIA